MIHKRIFNKGFNRV